MELLVTGCGRSGTTRTHKMFEYAGYSSMHETAVSCRGVNPQIFEDKDIEVSWLIPTFIEQIKKENKFDGPIWHQMRHPIKIAASYNSIGFFNKGGFHVECVTNLLGEDILNSSHPAMDFVIDWTNAIKKFRDYWYRIEDIKNEGLICMASNIIGTREVSEKKKLKDTLESTRLNSKGSKGIYDLTGYKRISELQELCDEHGYSLKGYL